MRLTSSGSMGSATSIGSESPFFAEGARQSSLGTTLAAIELRELELQQHNLRSQQQQQLHQQNMQRGASMPVLSLEAKSPRAVPCVRQVSYADIAGQFPELFMVKRRHPSGSAALQRRVAKAHGPMCTRRIYSERAKVLHDTVRTMLPQASMSSGGSTPTWIDGQGLNHDAYVAALRADEANKRHALSGAVGGGGVDEDPQGSEPQRAASLADGVAAGLQLPGSDADALQQLLDWGPTMPQRVAAAVAAAEAEAARAVSSSAAAAAAAAGRTSYDALLVSAPNLVEMARTLGPMDQRPPLSRSSNDRGSFYRCWT